MILKLYSLKKKVPPRLVVQVVQERKLCKQVLRHHLRPWRTRALPIRVYMKGKLRPKWVPFSGFRYIVYKKLGISTVESYEGVGKICHFGL